MSLDPIELLREYLRKEPARVISYGSALVVTAFVKGSVALGVTDVPDDVTIAIGLVTTFVLTEVIRRFVYAPATVDAIRKAGDEA